MSTQTWRWKPIFITYISLQFIPVLFQIKNLCFLNFRWIAFSHSALNAWSLYSSFISSCCMFSYILNIFYFLCRMFLYNLTHSFSLELIVSLFTFNCFDVYHLTCTFLMSISTTVKESDSDTIIMVIVLVAGVGGVFILFALMALCYR